MIVRSFKFLALAAALLVFAGLDVDTSTADMFFATSRGAVTSSGSIGAPGPTQNYIVGPSPEYRNFFDFNLGSIANQWATAASFNAQNTNNTNNQAGIFTLHQLTDSSSATLFADILAGTVYGSFNNLNPNAGTVSVGFNTAGLADLNAALGSSGALAISVGGTSPVRMFSGAGASQTSILDVTLQGNVTPTAGTDDYGYNLLTGGGITLDAQFDTLSFDADVAAFGDELIYEWTINGNAVGGMESMDTLFVDDADLLAAGVTSNGTYAVGLTITDRWGQSGVGSGSLIAVPEPGTVSLLCLGVMGLAMTRKRRR